MIVVGLIVGVGVISRSGEWVEAVLVVGVGVEGVGVFVLAGRGELVVGCGGWTAGSWGWGLKGCVVLRLRYWVVGLGGGGVWVVGEKLGDEIGIHCCWFDGVADGDLDGGWSGRVCLVIG